MARQVIQGLFVWCAGCFLRAEGDIKVSFRSAAEPEFKTSNAVGPTRVTTDGRALLVNGQPFFIKGVCWNPIPVGGDHPEGLDWAGMVDRDSKLMQEAGINAVRTYDGLTDTAVLDKLYERGIYVINNAYGYFATPLEDIRRIVEATKNHPAILMWSVGNEWNYNQLYSFGGLTYEETRERLLQATRMIKMLDPHHPVSTIYGELPFKPKAALGNDGKSYDYMEEIDVWSINVYRGDKFLDAYGFTLFEEWERGSAHNPKPMYIGEYGSDAWDARVHQPNESAQAYATRNLAQNILDNSYLTGGTTAGGFLFEFADEWWKDMHTPGHSVFVHDEGGVAPGGGPYPDGTFNEEWFGLLDIDRQPRLAWHAYAAIPTYPDSRGLMTAYLSFPVAFGLFSVSLLSLSEVVR